MFSFGLREEHDVFPAQAGVIPDSCRGSRRLARIPRASGGDPYMLAEVDGIELYSPRKRG